jgi:hypothetical protein
LFGRPRELRTRHSMADNIGGLKDNAIVPVPPFLSSVPSRLSSRCTGGRIPSLDGDDEMIHTQRTAESESEKRERQKREREAMRQAVANYTGPVTKCPPFKTTDPLARPKGRPRWPRRNASDHHKGTTLSLPDRRSE